jgi:hypothetical protein
MVKNGLAALLINGIEERRNKSNVARGRKHGITDGLELTHIRTGRQFRDAMTFGMVAALCLIAMCGTASAAAEPDVIPATALDRGFAGLYNLDFAGAQKDFSVWERQHPDDPVGPVSEAAGFLFSEFNRLGVLEGQFYENDDAFRARSKLKPDPAVHDHFHAAIEQTEKLAHARLNNNGEDQDALFALTLSSGLQADYAALVEKRNLASLHYAREASGWAQQLLAVCSNCYDAQLATGFSKYIIGSMSAPVRWIMKMGGLPGDKQGGIADLQLTAQRGHYLAPLARILLAIAYVRDKDKVRALELLSSLRVQFPGNTLFPREIARLQSAR